MTPLPVLLYHSISDDPPSWIAPFTVGRRAFAGQLDAIADSGRIAVTSSEVIAARRGEKSLPADAIAVTFDDGYRDFATNALPALASRGLPAALFVTTGALGPMNRSLLPAASMLTLRQVAELADAGVEIGAHTDLHTQLDTLRTADVESELSQPKQILEDTLGRTVDLFAYPYGYSSIEVRRLTQRAGYRGAFAVCNAFSPATDDPFRIARLTVRADMSRERFESWLQGLGAPLAPSRDRVQTVCWRAWRRSRSRLHMHV